MFSRNPQFAELHEQDTWYFVHEQGPRIATDDVLVAVWHAAHSRTSGEVLTLDSFRAPDGKSFHLSQYLITAILRVLVQADLLFDDSQDAQQTDLPTAAKQEAITGPKVSVIILHRNGPDIVAPCLQSLQQQTYPNIEVIVVDNNSTDNSRDIIRQDFPEVILVALERNLGFSAGNNAGLRQATGEYFLILNNDTELAPNCIEELINVAQQNSQAGAIVPKLRFYHLRRFLNGIGNHVSRNDWGSDNFIGHLDIGQFDNIHSVPSACFAAALLPRNVVRKVGLLDPDYFMYYEDSDWSYRARMQGFSIVTAPQAVVYHRFNTSSSALPTSFKLELIIRNRLRFVLKNFQLSTARQYIAAYLRQDTRNICRLLRHRQRAEVRAYLRGWGGFARMLPGLISRHVGIQRKRLPQATDAVLLQHGPLPTRQRQGHPSLTVEDVRGYYMHLNAQHILLSAPQVEFLDGKAGWHIWPENPSFIVSTGYTPRGARFRLSTVDDGRYRILLHGIFGGRIDVFLDGQRVGGAFHVAQDTGQVREANIGMIETHARTEHMLTLMNTGNRTSYIADVELRPVDTQADNRVPGDASNLTSRRLLIVSHDRVGTNMAGPGIRYVELSRALAKTLPVMLAVPAETDLPSGDFHVAVYKDDASLQKLVDEATIILVGPYLLAKHPFLRTVSQPLIVDLYDPFTLENLEIHRNQGTAERIQIHNADLAVLNEQLRRGDFFICASERQRDYWLGMLAALNRLNPVTYEDDKALRTLIDVVPFGIPSERPVHQRRVLKGVHPGIQEGDIVVLWGGGLWDWLDPLTLIDAMAQVATANARVKLFFMSTIHPNPEVPTMDIVRKSFDRSKELGLLDSCVFFNTRWIPYNERQNYLLEADIGVSLHHPLIETRFAFRTRLLDYLWADLPMVVTEGDSLSYEIAAHGLGHAVPYHDAAAITEAILALAAQPDLRTELGARFAAARQPFLWNNVADPLRAFCQNPAKAADYQFDLLAHTTTHDTAVRNTEAITHAAPPQVVPTPLRHLPAKAVSIARREGARGLFRTTVRFIRRKLH